MSTNSGNNENEAAQISIVLRKDGAALTPPTDTDIIELQEIMGNIHRYFHITPGEILDYLRAMYPRSYNKEQLLYMDATLVPYISREDVIKPMVTLLNGYTMQEALEIIDCLKAALNKIVIGAKGDATKRVNISLEEEHKQYRIIDEKFLNKRRESTDSKAEVQAEREKLGNGSSLP